MNLIKKISSFFGSILQKKARTMSINQHHANETEVLSIIGRNLYLNAEKADVHFIFESGDVRVPAHKILLSSGSDVFQTMFYGPLKEEGDIKIVDATAEAFKEFLRFFYYNKVDVSMEHVWGVMYLGRKYNVADCQRLCVNLLAANITDQTVISTLSLAIFHEEKQLQKSCELIIASRTNEVFKSENFLVCDRRVLEHILKMDSLACTEQALFEACMSWVRATSNEDHLTRDIVQTHLGRLFYEIRFGAMTSEEFGKLLPVYGELFSADEYNDIFRVFSGQEMKPKIFQTEQRLCNWDLKKIIVCNRGVEYAAECQLKSQSLTKFSSNTRLLLRYLVIVPIFTYCRGVVQKIENVEVTVIADSTEVTQFTCALEYSGAGYKVDLPSPISITPSNFYEIRIKFPSDEKRQFPTDEHQCSYWLLDRTVKMENNVVLVFQDSDRPIVRTLGFNGVQLAHS